MLQVFWCNRNKTNKQWPDQPLLFTCVNIFLAPALSSANGEYRLLTERVCSRRKGLRKYLLIMNRPKLWLFFFSLSLTLLPPLLHPPPHLFLPPSPRNDSSQLWSWCVEFIPRLGSVRNGSLHHSSLYESVYFISEMFPCAFALLWLAEGERK